MLRRHHYAIILFVSFLVFLTPLANGQTIENLYLEQAGSKIIIHYDFVADNTDNTYQLKVYHSIDGFTNPRASQSRSRQTDRQRSPRHRSDSD